MTLYCLKTNTCSDVHQFSQIKSQIESTLWCGLCSFSDTLRKTNRTSSHTFFVCFKKYACFKKFLSHNKNQIRKVESKSRMYLLILSFLYVLFRTIVVSHFSQSAVLLFLQPIQNKTLPGGCSFSRLASIQNKIQRWFCTSKDSVDFVHQKTALILYIRPFHSYISRNFPRKKEKVVIRYPYWNLS